MIRLSDVLTQIIARNPILQFGLRERLWNLSKLSAYLTPQIAVRAKKEVKSSAILMALSRLQRTMGTETLRREDIRIEKLVVHTGLSTYTFVKTDDAHRGVHRLYMAVQKKEGFMTVSEGVHQITVIVETEFIPLLKAFLPMKPLYRHANIASLGVMFDPVYTTGVPGFICMVLQQLLLQRINLVEISSTFTELILYLDEEDTKVAFDTLYSLFSIEQVH